MSTVAQVLSEGCWEGEVEQTWNDIYEKNLTPALARLRGISGVVLGFHSVIDGIKRVKAAEIEAIFNANPDLESQVLAKIDAVPVEISTPADMLAGLLASLRAGRSFRMVIREESAFRWMLRHFGYDRLKLGGTSGCMENSLAPLAAPCAPTIMYQKWLAENSYYCSVK
ncbi:MAG: hypothetical protein O7E52_13310 [Candidatus Poribacteria bacterium]|nr:hypothetical protein [Candidatus Poribacteria bacterium]